MLGRIGSSMQRPALIDEGTTPDAPTYVVGVRFPSSASAVHSVAEVVSGSDDLYHEWTAET